MSPLSVVKQSTAILIAVFLSSWSSLSFAHPHVWVTFDATATRTGGLISALHETWTFDEDFTAMVFHDILKHRMPKSLSGQQVAALEREAFSNMQTYAYFHHLHAGAKAIGVKKATDFNAKLAGDKLVYTFDLPLKEPVDPAKQPLRIGIWDDTYFVDMEPVDLHHAVRVKGSNASGCQSDTAPDKKHPIYYGMVFPLVTQISCKAL